MILLYEINGCNYAVYISMFIFYDNLGPQDEIELGDWDLENICQSN